MSAISIDDVKKLADLSALSLSEEQLDHMANELKRILSYVEQLEAIDTTGIEPTYQVHDTHTVTRADEVIDYGVDQTALLDNASHVKDGQIEVRKVI